MTQENTTPEQNVEIEMEQAEDESSKPVHHQTKRGADLAIATQEISQESHKAVIAGEITLAEAKELGRNAGPDGPVGEHEEGQQEEPHPDRDAVFVRLRRVDREKVSPWPRHANGLARQSLRAWGGYSD
jgi:hypothetical protein